MKNKYKKTCSRIALLIVGLVILLSVSGVTARSQKVDHKVYVAFGFHVNLYHSFRNDTNDEYGFGKDIRVIRDIIHTLDRYNDQGVPVMGVWDFDNLFSLQERLPKYAPDIIRDVRRRVKDRGDEVILMSYNNGLVSAMTHQELTDTMQWAVSNPWGSGVKDLFGQYSPIVRPQEMMTTPGNFRLYGRQGIEAVCLYYSATPFDAFRVFARPLKRVEAYNPITFLHPDTHEEMKIIPTYHIGDLLENVSLRNWAARLHNLQKKGEIDGDVLIYINYDADSEFWSGIDLSWPLTHLPNTRGLAGLIDEVKDVDYVEFTILQNYLDHHPSVGSFYFGQDTADGSFDGYNSWSEKENARRYWTRIERHRRIHQVALQAMDMLGDGKLEAALGPLLRSTYLKRMRALSTTNFGMATPFLAPGRETAMEQLLEDMDKDLQIVESVIRSSARSRFQANVPPIDTPYGFEWVDSLLLIGANDGTPSGSGRFLNLVVNADLTPEQPLYLMTSSGRKIRTRTVHHRSLSDAGSVWRKIYLPERQPLADGLYHLYTSAEDREQTDLSATADRLANGRVDLRFDSAGRVSGLFINGDKKLSAGSLIPYIRHQGRIEQTSDIHISPGTVGNGVASVHMRGVLPGPRGITRSDGGATYRYSLVENLPYLFVDGYVKYPLTVENYQYKSDEPDLARNADNRWREVAPLELRFTHRASTQDPIRIIKQNFLGISSSYALNYFRHDEFNLSLDNVNNHITAAYLGLVAGGQGMAVGMDTHVAANFAFSPVKATFNAGDKSFTVKANPFGTYHGEQYRHPTWGNCNGYEVTIMAGEQFHSAGPTYNGADTTFAVMLAFFDGQQLPHKTQADLIRYARPPMVFSLTTENGGMKNIVFRKTGEPRMSEDLASGMIEKPPQKQQRRLPFKLQLKVLWANIGAYLSRNVI